MNLVSIFRCSSSPCNPVYASRVDPSILAFSLSLHRHPHICIPFTYRFISGVSWATLPLCCYIFVAAFTRCILLLTRCIFALLWHLPVWRVSPFLGCATLCDFCAMRSCARELRLCFAVNATLELVARVTTAVALTAYAWDNLRSDVCCWSPFLGFSGDGNFVKFSPLHGSSSRFPLYVDAQNWTLHFKNGTKWIF